MGNTLEENCNFPERHKSRFEPKETQFSVLHGFLNIIKMSVHLKLIYKFMKQLGLIKIQS